MALSWNEIKDRALAFSKEWEVETRENAEAKSFWDGFFNVFGISRRRVASFEQPVKKLNEKYGFIDLFWKGTLLVEHKSKGKDLDKAYSQALDYFNGLKENELPKYVLVSDFEKFRLYDLEDGVDQQFDLKELHDKVRLFGFIAGYQKKTYKAEDPVNIKAAYIMGELHDQLKAIGYKEHDLEVYLVRLLFCLFADDTSIFEKDIFLDYILQKTNKDGSDLSMHIERIFDVLNKPVDERFTNLDEHLAQFPYVNGKLFEERLPSASFDSKMRQTLIDCCYLDWGKISPAIFGSMFQSIMNADERREMGAHYTSEGNILKLIRPLFLDDLHQEFNKVKRNTKQLRQFHKKLSTLKFLDPACGCGNFLVITYRELRLLELEVLRALFKNQLATDIESIMWIDVDQFFGIEYEEWPARIAEVAMWLMDHQMNMRISEEFGQYFVRLPLKKAATIFHGNALIIPWNEIIKSDDLDYILGNPPFVGKHYQSKDQKEDITRVFENCPGSGLLDYVAAWFVLASKYIQGTSIRVGFVSTNSIAQGEQVGILWSILFENFGIKIHFAFQTFKWNNEAKRQAAVHVVIVGFGNFDVKKKLLYHFENIKGEPLEMRAANINPYLVEGDDVVINARRKPICSVPPIVNGSKPVDGGGLILSADERKRIIANNPAAKKFIKQFAGADDYIKGKKRWCLWLSGVEPQKYRNDIIIKERLEQVRDFRLQSAKEATRRNASSPMLFQQIRQPDADYVLIPRVSSENRKYLPVGFLPKEIIVSDSATFVANATLYHFGILASSMHITWVKYVCGRLKSDFRYSNKIVYNNFPWPNEPGKKNVKRIEECAQKVLDTRAEYPNSSLADLYDQLSTPPNLTKAHESLDKAIDRCYRPQAFPNELSRIEFLFDLYHEYMKTSSN